MGKIPKRYRNVPEWKVWDGIKRRCYHLSYKDRHRYGGRGIVMSDEWRNSFDQFYADMGKRPEGAYTIDRIDNDGNYCKENCRWATPTEQARNQSKTRFIEYNGEKRCISEWAKILGLDESTIRARLNNNWDIEKVLCKKHSFRNTKPNPKPKYKPVICVNSGVIYPSLNDASKSVGIACSSLCAHLKKPLLPTSKYQMRYYTEYLANSEKDNQLKLL